MRRIAFCLCSALIKVGPRRARHPTRLRSTATACRPTCSLPLRLAAQPLAGARFPRPFTLNAAQGVPRLSCRSLVIPNPAWPDGGRVAPLLANGDEGPAFCFSVCLSASPLDAKTMASAHKTRCPCPCGFFGDPTRDCHCTPMQIQRYVSKLSGPLLDRIDIHIEVPAVKYKERRGTTEAEPSASVRQRVMDARRRQLDRYAAEKKIYANAQITPKLLRKHCGISADGEKLLETAIQKLGLSARAHDRILKVARTIADLDGIPDIQPRQLSEAIQYRTLDRTYWA